MTSKHLSVYLTRGLEGRDEQIDLLTRLFEESQTLTIETADPVLDLITFAQDCTDFWVINAREGDSGLPLDEPQEEFSNSLGLLPSNPFGPHEANSSNFNDIDNTVEKFSTREDNGQPYFSDHPRTAIAPMPKSNYSTAQRGPLVLSLPPSSALPSWNRYSSASDKIVAGFAYLRPSSALPDPLHYQEYNMGIILCPEWRSRGVATKALQLVLEHVFSQPNVHRVQAQLIDCYKNVQALTLFTRMGFSHEGTRRQGFYCPLTTEWRDVTTLALLVTDWVIHVRDRDGFQSAPKSLWDALFMRHQREREELLRWEDRRPRRSSSLETLRGGAATPVPLRPQELNASDSDDVEAASEGELSSVERQKRKRSENGGNGLPAKVRDAYDASSSENESDYESAVEGSPWKRARSRAGIPSSADLSTPASLLLSNGPDSNLDPSYGNIRTLDDQLGEGPSASPGPSSISSPTSLGPTSGNVLPAPPRMRSISLSPDLDLGSPATSPLDTESEYEDLGGYASSNTESSSPSGSWDMMSNASERSPSP